MDDKVFRNYLFKIIQNKTNNGYHPNLLIDGVKNSDERKEIVDKLVRLGCLKEGYLLPGRNGIEGVFDYSRVKELIESGKIG